MDEKRPRQRRFAPRSRQGCLTCRARRKRCDGRHPECQNCVRVNVQCEWQKQRQVVSTPVPSESAVPRPPAITALDQWNPLIGDDEGSERRRLLQYYIEAFVPSVSVANTASSFFTKLYIPMASESEGVLDAIVACASSQLAKRTTDTERAQHLQTLSAKHQTRCHSFLRARISPSGQPNKDKYQVLAATLLLIALEALNGTRSTKWVQQLRCVQRMLDTACREVQPESDAWELECLRRHFTYHDVMAALGVGVWEDARSSPIAEDIMPHKRRVSTIDPLMGLSYNLFSLIRRIQYVAGLSPVFPLTSQAAFETVEREILDWKYESPLTNEAIDLPVALDLIALAETYRLAALVLLYRRSESHKGLVSSCASRAMSFIARIPMGSPAESSLVYPLFLVGAELGSEEEMATCSLRLESIRKRNSFENVRNVEQVLQEVWKPVPKGHEKKRWEHVLKEWNWSISLG